MAEAKRNRLHELTDRQFYSLAHRLGNACDRLMNDYASGSRKYGHGGSLSFGWDWPTFGMLFPRMMARVWAVRDENKRRKGQKSAA
jgi:hypothetical protein